MLRKLGLVRIGDWGLADHAQLAVRPVARKRALWTRPVGQFCRGRSRRTTGGRRLVDGAGRLRWDRGFASALASLLPLAADRAFAAFTPVSRKLLPLCNGVLSASWYLFAIHPGIRAVMIVQ